MKVSGLQETNTELFLLSINVAQIVLNITLKKQSIERTDQCQVSTSFNIWALDEQQNSGAKYYWGDQIKKDEMAGACSMGGREEKCIQYFGWKT
jgi:hypothetical protein